MTGFFFDAALDFDFFFAMTSGLCSPGLQIVLRLFDRTSGLVVFVDQNDLSRVVLDFFFVELSVAANDNDVVDLNEPRSDTIVFCEPMTV